jgi:Tfp pilus assembly major pilin PilA
MTIKHFNLSSHLIIIYVIARNNALHLYTNIVIKGVLTLITGLYYQNFVFLKKQLKIN